MNCYELLRTVMNCTYRSYYFNSRNPDFPGAVTTLDLSASQYLFTTKAAGISLCSLRLNSEMHPKKWDSGEWLKMTGRHSCFKEAIPQEIRDKLKET